jgi:hypothetical protein
MEVPSNISVVPSIISFDLTDEKNLNPESLLLPELVFSGNGLAPFTPLLLISRSFNISEPGVEIANKTLLVDNDPNNSKKYCLKSSPNDPIDLISLFGIDYIPPQIFCFVSVDGGLFCFSFLFYFSFLCIKVTFSKNYVEVYISIIKPEEPDNITLEIILFSSIGGFVIISVVVISITLIRCGNSKKMKYTKITSASIAAPDSNVLNVTMVTGNTAINEKEVKIKVKRVFD